MSADTRSASASRLTVVLAEERHAPAVAAFIRTVWTPTATAESVAAAWAEEARTNTAEPGVVPPTWIALRDDQVIGYVTSLPVRWWDGRRDWPGYWIKGLMVLPEFRNGPIGYLLLKTATARLSRSGALAAAPPARRLFEALGYRDLGAVPNWLRPLAPHRMLQRLDPDALGLANRPGIKYLRVVQATGLAAAGGWVAGLLLRTAARAVRLPSFAFDTDEQVPDAAALDLLWERVRGGFPPAVVRDGHYLRRRYPSGPDSPYVWIAARRGGLLRGVAILRRPRTDGDPRLRGIRLATVADVVLPFGDRATGYALLGEVERQARRLGADGLLASSAVPELQHILRRQGYLPIGGNVHFLWRDVTGDGAPFGTMLPAWWITRGDGLSDEVF